MSENQNRQQEEMESTPSPEIPANGNVPWSPESVVPVPGPVADPFMGFAGYAGARSPPVPASGVAGSAASSSPDPLPSPSVGRPDQGPPSPAPAAQAPPPAPPARVVLPAVAPLVPVAGPTGRGQGAQLPAQQQPAPFRPQPLFGVGARSRVTHDQLGNLLPPPPPPNTPFAVLPPRPVAQMGGGYGPAPMAPMARMAPVASIGQPNPPVASGTEHEDVDADEDME